MDLALKAIAEPRRREILRLVLTQERTAGDIAMRFSDVSGPAISQHLRVLIEAGLLTVRRDGSRRWYRARPQTLHEVRSYLEELWRSSLAALAEEAELEERRKGHGDHPQRN